MSDSGRPGFLSRWSQRKLQARENRQVRDEDPAAERTDATPAGQPAAEVLPGRDRPGHDGLGVASPVDGVAGDASIASRPDAASPQAGQVGKKSLPGLEDVKLLTPDSDFSPFVARGVAPAVKNAAMKKLFADPHFNVMDGLDIYIDDYTQREILPESMMRKMVSSKFLRMFEHEDEAQASGAGQQPASTEGDAETLAGNAGQNYPQPESENSDPVSTGMVSSPDEARVEVPGAESCPAGPLLAESPRTGVPAPEFPGVIVPDAIPQAETQAAAALGVSPGLPTSPAGGQNRPEASSKSIAKSEKTLGDAPSDAKPHERSN